VILLLVLILVATLFIMAAGFLTTRTREREVVKASRDAFQAHQLAYSGLETVRVRMLNDFDFPPLREASQEVFKFSEVVMDYDGTNEVGRYQIFCDRRWSDTPYFLLRVTSVGQVGDADGNPVRHKMIGEFDMRPGFKGDMINLIDLGSF
jgi:hypothetical protein